MRLSFTIFFIFFSVVTSVFEYSEHESVCKELSSISETYSISGTDNHCPEQSSKSCHDSNCYGFAHFGHGFYCEPEAIAVEENLYSLESGHPFSSTNPHSLVYLDSIFRPPLA